MKLMLIFCFAILFGQLPGCTQPGNTHKPATRTGGPCEGCEAMLSSPVRFEKLNWFDSLPDFHEPGPKLILSGVIYQSDGKTPAKDVVIYIYHTDQTGHYTNKYKEKGWAGRHGYIKGWARTNARGEYKFYTLKPAPYPGTNIPAHIHPVIKEPGKNEYYIDEYLFEGDPFLTVSERNKQEKRGGSGIIVPEKKDGMLLAKRDIILGKNIPNYVK